MRAWQRLVGVLEGGAGDAGLREDVADRRPLLAVTPASSAGSRGAGPCRRPRVARPTTTAANDGQRQQTRSQRCALRNPPMRPEAVLAPRTNRLGAPYRERCPKVVAARVARSAHRVGRFSEVAVEHLLAGVVGRARSRPPIPGAGSRTRWPAPARGGRTARSARWSRRACWPRSMLSKTKSTTSGASPSDISSAMISFGGTASARASASICCSPPESVPARWVRRSASTGNSSYALLDRRPCARRGCRPAAPPCAGSPAP